MSPSPSPSTRCAFLGAACSFVAIPALLLGGCSPSTSEPTGAGASQPVLRFTAIPDKNTQDLRARFDPVATWLSAQLGVAVEYVPSASYEASVQMFKNGDVHLAWFGGLTGVQARAAVTGARAIVQGREDVGFKSYFVANATTGLERTTTFPEGLAGLTFTFGDRQSTSGRLMPEHFVRTLTGKSPAEFFGSEPGFSGNHELTAAWVQSGRFQAGALNYQVYEAGVKSGKIDPNVVRVVWETPAYADYNMTAHPEIDAMFGAGFVDRLQATLLAMTDAQLLAAFGRTALVPASNDDFAGCAEVARSLDLLRG